LIGDVKNKKVLDIGCASGYLGKEIKEKEAREVVGIDISENQIKEAENNLDKAFVIDIQTEKIPLENKYFDIVLLPEVIEHLFKTEDTAREIRRVLKDDGFVIITTPNFLVFSNRIKMLFGRFDYEDSGVFDRGHIHFFSRFSLLKFIKENGFELLEENSIFHPKIPKFLAKLFPNLFVFQIIIKVKKN
jgi:SAM-dependent methyltransferase